MRNVRADGVGRISPRSIMRLPGSRGMNTPGLNETLRYSSPAAYASSTGRVMSPVCRSSIRPPTRRTTMSQQPSGVVTPRQARSKRTRVTSSTSGESDARISRTTLMRPSIRARRSRAQRESAATLGFFPLAAQHAERFSHVADPVLRHRHGGVMTAVRILRPADDVVAGFAVTADGDVAVLEDGDGGRHARVCLRRPRARIVRVLVVEADAG